MGQEKEATLRANGETYRGKALLETDEILFRGDTRLRIAFKSMTRVEAARGRLKITHAGGEADFELGAAAETWAEKIKNPKGRLDKLGIKAGSDVVLVGDFAFDEELRAELEARGCAVATRATSKRTLILFAAGAKGDLAKIPKLRDALAAGGALWIVYPKGKTEIREADVREAALGAKLVDVKVARFSETHTALKLMLRKA